MGPPLPLLVQKQSGPPEHQMSEAELEQHNKAVMKKVKSTGDPALDNEAWTKTKAEFVAGTMLGPFDRFEDIPARNVQLLPRFPIWERNGGAVDWKVRMVDDCKFGRQNYVAATSAAYRLADLDQLVVLLRAVGCK